MSEKTIPEPNGDASAEKPKNRGGRPRGSRSKVGHREPSPTWLRDMCQECHTRDEYIALFRGLTAFEKFSILARLAPKDLKLDTQSTVRMEVVGLLVGDAYRRQILQSKSKQALPSSTEAQAVVAAHEDYQKISEREEE